MKKIYPLLLMAFFAITRMYAQPVNGTTTFFTNTTTALQPNTGCVVTKTTALSGWLFSISSTSNCGFNWTNTTGGDGRFQFLAGFGTVTQLTFGSDDGSEFAMNNLVWGVSTSSWTAKPMSFVGYKNGLPVSGATLNATTPSGTGMLNTVTITFTNNPMFYDVDEIRLAPNTTTCNSILFFEEITIGTSSASCTTPTVSVVGSGNVLCNGGSTGSATMSASGGSGFTYTWYPSGGNASSASGLSAGIYTLYASNSCGSIGSRTIQLTEPPGLVTSTAVTNALCNGSTGSATVSASGGTGSYTYSWSAGSTNSFVTLLAGTYTVKTTDANGCVSNKSVTISQPSAVGTSTGYTNVLCNGGSTGSASIAVSGGTSPYTYTWSTASTSSVSTGLTAGSYTVKVIDANGCSSITRTINITQPSAIVTSTAATSPLCNGGLGSATVTASGGTGAYSYTWSSGPTTSVEPTLLAGTYTVKTTDANNCSVTNSVTILQPSALVTSTALTNALCNGGSGSATVTASGGTGAYSYTWSSGPTTSIEPTLLAGTYTVKVTDANNCSSTKSVTINQPPAIVTSTASSSPMCNGGQGSATVTASGGTGAYSYTWSSGPTTSVAPTLLAGTYTVKVTDANNCSSTKSVTINQPSAIVTSTAVTNSVCNGIGSATISATGGTGAYTYFWSTGATTSVISAVSGVYSATVTDANNCTSTKSAVISSPFGVNTNTIVINAACNGGNGSATITASGGTGPYTYAWSNGATSPFANNLPAGNYTATATDANGCTSTKSVTVGQPSALVTTTALTNALCNGGTGSATITASGGTGAYTYLWSTAATSSVVSGLPGGVYSATVTDANSCKSTKSVVITQPAALITSTTIANALCNGGNGSATVTASGGTGAYTYLWSSAATTSVTSLSAGVHTSTVTDVNGCTATASVTIIQPSALLTSTAVNNASCNGGTGSATITASGGTGSYTYLWSTAATTSVVSGLPSGIYTATVTDANACSITKSVTITQPSALVTTTALTNALCNGGTGSATITASGGTGAYTYSWTTSATTSVVSGLPAGIHSVTVTDANSCTSTKSIIITQPPALVTSTTVSNVLCYGGNGSATVTASGGSGAYTYAWSTAATASVASLSNGIHTSTVTDANGCTATATVTITQPASALGTSTAVNNVLCNGGTTGSATITASGGTPGYTYLWSTSATTSVITGQTSGVKTVTVTDANGCTATNTVNINQPVMALSTSTAISNVLCNGGATGSASVTVNGGTPGYTYLWSTSATTSVISGMNAGVKTITVTDANGCTATNSVTISQPATLATFTSVSNVLCNGGTTGSATITASGGASGYTYLWSTSSTSSVITNQTAGVKTVTVTDANLCVSTNTVTITEPGVLTTSTLASNVLCNGGSSGSATVIANGGTAGYSYLWSTAGTASVIGGQISGVKTVTVTDANGCTATNTVTITEPPALTASTLMSNVLCNGGSTGSATVTATGGTPGYSYLWSTSATTSVITNATAGVKTVTVTDANFCTVTNTVTISEPLAISVSTLVNNVLCNGGTTGAATIIANGGTPGYTYLWSTAATTSIITNQNAGVKTVTITDANNCTSTSTVSITEPASALNTTVAVNSVLCNGGSTGSATVIASGGTSGYSYLWSTAATSSLITSETAGVKTVTVTDANGCTATNSITISEPSALVTSTAVNNVLCNGGANGSATIIASGGTPGYTYLWSTTATTSVVTNEMVGVKTVTVTDVNNCTATNTITITEPASLITSTAVSNVLCNGGSTGSATVTASGGTPGYTYLWSTASTSSVTTGETAGVKTVTVSDANGCITTASVVITEPLSALSVSASVSNVLCNGGASGSATITVNGGTPGYTYSWSTAATTSVITGVTAGVKTVTVSDANACTITTLVTITEPSPIVTSTMVNNVLCNGGATGSATVTASGGAGIYSYLWSTTAVGSVITGEPAGVKTVTVTDVNGCAVSTTVTIAEPSALTAVKTQTDVTCVVNGLAQISVSGGTGPYSYNWFPSGGNAATSSALTTGNYTCTVTDANNCSLMNLFTISANTVSPVISIGPDVEVNSGSSHQFNPVQTGAVSFTWTPGMYLNSVSVINPVTTPENDITYVLSITAANGCTSSDTVFVKFLITDLVIANYMSPNGDGINDTWKVNAPRLIKDYSVTIVDSYGKTVYTVPGNYNNEFDGKFAGQDLPDGVYYYFIKDNNSLKHKGSITITR